MPTHKIAPGVALWVAFRKRNKISIAAAGRALRVSGPAICSWEDSSSRPKLPMRDAIAVYTRGEVPASAWLYPGETLAVEVAPFVAKGAA